MRIGVKVEGGREHQAAMDFLLARLDRATRSATKDAAEELSDRVKEYLHTYTHPPTTHRTPSPAFIGPPAWVTGALEGSVHVIGPSLGGRYRWRAYVAPDVEYDRIQELGGMSGQHHATFTPPRPYLGPMTIESIVSGGVQRQFVLAWERVLSVG